MGVLRDGSLRVAEDTALPTAGRYTGLLDDRPVELEVTPEGAVLVAGSRGPRAATARFLDRVER